MNFSQAVAFAKEGKLIARAAWGRKGVFAFMRPADELSASVIAGAKSIPDSAKEFFAEKKVEVVPVSGYLCLKSEDDSIVNGWVAPQADMLATDWVEVGGKSMAMASKTKGVAAVAADVTAPLDEVTAPLDEVSDDLEETGGEALASEEADLAQKDFDAEDGGTVDGSSQEKENPQTAL